MKQNIDVHKIFADYFNSNISKALAYAVSQKLSEGHICLDIEKYNHLIFGKEESELLEMNPFLKQGDSFDIAEIIKDSFITSSLDVICPLVVNEGKVYLHRYFEYETEIIQQIKNFVEQESTTLDLSENILSHQTDLIHTLFESSDDTGNLPSAESVNWQLVAALTAIIKKLSIITGGPGTGKTTTVAKILAILYSDCPMLKVALAAPTGKAAARMKESLSHAKDSLAGLSEEVKSLFDDMEAKTIHRLLGYKKNSPYFKHNADNTLEYDVIIIDESSMISAPMMAKLMTSISTSARLIFLGDKNQLASVDAGSVFGDICLSLGDNMNVFSESNAQFINAFIAQDKLKIQTDFISSLPMSHLLSEHIIELKRSHRFKSTEGIGLFSKALIQGHISDKDYKDSEQCKGEYVKVVGDDNSSLLDEFMIKYKSYIEEKVIKKALQKLNDVRFLCTVHEGKYGVNHYNMLITEFLKKKDLLNPQNGFYENQPIIIKRNDYALGLFNGDVGIIRKDDKGVFKAWFESVDGSVKQVLPGFISAYETVFAMTIHKSQGSEFTSVAVILPNDENLAILTRELLYTGITRGKKEVVIFGDKAVIDSAALRKVERASGIIERIQ
ncbi:exodeoxyribonuclease V subunit alpha [Ancylomarina sp. YFZ004]